MKNELSLEITMTIKEVANALGKDESTIRKIGKSLFPGTFRNGVKTTLNEKQVTAIKLKLGKNSELPKTQLEKELIIQQAMLFQAEKINVLQAELQEIRPKAALADEAIRDDQEHYSITQAGKHIGLRQSEIFAILREKKMLTAENLPTQKAIDSGILQLRTNANCNGRNRQQSIMTMQNIYNFKRRYC